MKKKIIRIIKIIAGIAPLVIGFVGFLRVEGIEPRWAFYYSTKHYGFTWQPYSNPFIEVAKWTAPLVTGTVAVSLIKKLARHIKSLCIARKPQSCSVYGDSENAGIFLRNLGSRGVRGDIENPYKTRYHVVMTGDNESAAALLGRFPKSIAESSKIILCMDNVSPMTLQQSNAMSYSIEQSRAGNYWSENAPEKGEKIAMIGGGELFDAMLTKGLLLNITAPDQALEYHLWSDTDEYISSHSELENILAAAGDKMLFHGNSPLSDLELLTRMDRVILCRGDSENIILTSKLLELAPIKALHISCGDSAGTARLFSSDPEVKCFGDRTELLTFENVVRERTVSNAKAINEHYRAKYGTEDWESLSVMKRRSGISAAEFFPVLRRLREKGASINELSELEHIRWCRFYWLNNWHYGAERDEARRIHNGLVPFSELTPEQIEKDTENVELALSKEMKQE